MREGIGINAEGVNPKISPFVAVFPIIVKRKSSGRCWVDGLGMFWIFLGDAVTLLGRGSEASLD